MKNINLKFKISVLLVFSLFFLPLELNKTDAAVSDTLTKTVEFFIGQDAGSGPNVRQSGEQFSFYFSNVVIPETPTVKNAIIEINGVSYNNSGNQTINVDLEQGLNPPGLGTNYTLSGTTKPKPFTLNYDAWQSGLGPMSNIVAANTAYNYTLYLAGTSAGGTGSYSISSAKLTLTYEYSVTNSDFLKTTKFFIDQETGSAPSGTEISKDFTLTVPEQDPVIESVFIEVSGIAKGSGIGTVGISVVDQGAPANYSYYNLDLGGSTNITKFISRYDASANILSASFPGSKTYTLYLKGTGFQTNLWNAKIIVTYKYHEGATGLPPSGYVVSSTMDTGITDGVAFNSAWWLGTLNGGKVKMQFAASNCLGGQNDYPTCSTGSWEYLGPTCTSDAGDVYDLGSPDSAVEIMCAATNYNNKRYFRYKLIICSASDCTSSGAASPEVTGVVVNWAP